MKTLMSLLYDIEQGKPINFSRLVSLLPDGIDWQELFEPKPFGKKAYIVTIKDSAAFDALLSSIVPPKNREAAAVSSFYDTHDLSCASGYLLVYPACTRKLTPVTVINLVRQPPPFECATKAVLIENQDCFFNWEILCQSFDKQIDIQTCDMILTSGNKIQAKLYLSMLNQYAELYCMFDYDWAGFSNAAHIQKKSTAKVEFLLPDDLSNMTSLFKKKPENQAHFIKLLDATKNLKYNVLHEVLVKTLCHMEQEALLTQREIR